MAKDTRILLQGLKEYFASLETHINQLNSEYQQLENSWLKFNSVAQGDYADQFRGGWLKTQANFRDYINQSLKIKVMLEERINFLEQFNQNNQDISVQSLSSSHIINNQGVMFSGAGGNWAVIGENFDPNVVKQNNSLCCVSACGEMLLKSQGITNINQTKIEELCGSPTFPELLADALNNLAFSTKGKWWGNCVSSDSFDALISTGSWGAVLWETSAKIGHMVVVAGIEKNQVIILDPWQGTRYKMKKSDFLDHWNGQSIYWIKNNGN
jgi:hypothetical protein